MTLPAAAAGLPGRIHGQSGNGRAGTERDLVRVVVVEGEREKKGRWRKRGGGWKWWNKEEEGEKKELEAGNGRQARFEARCGGARP